MKQPSRLRALATLGCIAAGGFFLAQCSETTEPLLPGTIRIFSGDNQTSLKGTELQDPLIVVVKTNDNSVPEATHVVFRVIQGGGTVSNSVVAVDQFGRASTRLTLGPNLGTNLVRAEVDVEGGGKKSLVFTAMAANYFCPEAEDTLRVSYGSSGNLFLVTPKSEWYPDPNSAGIVQINPNPLFPSVFGYLEIPLESFFVSVIWDAAFSPRGDFFVARRLAFNEIIKVGTDRSVTVFSLIEDASEITLNPTGLLVGCDTRGPFIVGCRDTLLRFPEATFASGVNNDAVAVDPRRQVVDPLGEDIYFIYKPDSTLQRLPMDSLTVESPVQIVASLSRAEADWARGMVCDQNGFVYILVDDVNRKALLRVAPGGGVVTELFDFFSRGSGTAAGRQRDLALDFPYLYTIDTLNNKLLRYDVVGSNFLSLINDPLDQSIVSSPGSDGERVGLAALP